MDDALTDELADEFDIIPHDRTKTTVLQSFDPFSLEVATIAVDILVGLGVDLTYDLLKDKILSVVNRLRKRKEVTGPLAITFNAGEIRFNATIHDNKAVTIKTWERAGTKGWIQKDEAYPFGEPDDRAAIGRAERYNEAVADAEHRTAQDETTKATE